MIIQKLNGLHFVHYDDVTEIMNTKPKEDRFDRTYGSKGQYISRDWLGTNSIHEFHNNMIHGWPEAVKRTECLKIAGVPIIRKQKRFKKQSDFGDELDIQKVYGGDLDTAWLTFERKDTEDDGKHVVTIVVDMSTHGGIPGDKAFWKGATAAILCDQLTARGKSTEIIAINYISNVFVRSYDKLCNAVTVKDSMYPTDREMLHAILSPGFHRYYFMRAKFWYAEQINDTVELNTGAPCATKKDVCALFPGRKILYVPNTLNTQESAEDFLNRTITTLEI